MTTNSTGYVLLSQGEYSDYQNTAFRVLKPFTFAEPAAAFRAQWAPDPERTWCKAPGPDAFIGWLNAEGYIADAPESQEVHVGAYTFDDSRKFMHPGLAETTFLPGAIPTSQPADGTAS